MYVYLDSKRVSLLIGDLLTLPMLYMYLPLCTCIPWFKESKPTRRRFANITNDVPSLNPYVYLDSKRVSLLIGDLPTLLMLYLYVYLDSKRVSLLIGDLPTLLMLYLPLCIPWFKESKPTHRRFANITNAVPSLMYIRMYTCTCTLIQRQ